MRTLLVLITMCFLQVAQAGDQSLVCGTSKDGKSASANFLASGDLNQVDGMLNYSHTHARLVCPSFFMQRFLSEGKSFTCVGYWDYDFDAEGKEMATQAEITVTKTGDDISAFFNANKVYGGTEVSMPCQVVQKP